MLFSIRVWSYEIPYFKNGWASCPRKGQLQLVHCATPGTVVGPLGGGSP